MCCFPGSLIPVGFNRTCPWATSILSVLLTWRLFYLPTFSLFAVLITKKNYLSLHVQPCFVLYIRISLSYSRFWYFFFHILPFVRISYLYSPLQPSPCWKSFNYKYLLKSSHFGIKFSQATLVQFHVHHYSNLIRTIHSMILWNLICVIALAFMCKVFCTELQTELHFSGLLSNIIFIVISNTIWM